VEAVIIATLEEGAPLLGILIQEASRHTMSTEVEVRKTGEDGIISGVGGYHLQ
jgi:hypothetical protein